MVNTHCIWHIQEDGSYNTDCGKESVTPIKKAMYCCFCGKLIGMELPPEEVPEEEKNLELF